MLKRIAELLVAEREAGVEKPGRERALALEEGGVAHLAEECSDRDRGHREERRSP